MGLSSDLLDGFDVLYRRTEGVLKVSTEMATFFKKLAILEAEHAKTLSKLSASYGQKKLLSNPHADGTVHDAWEVIFKSLDSTAAKTEAYAHSLMKEVSLAMYDFVKDKDVTRKRLTTEGQKLTKDMKSQLDTLTKVKGNYIKLSKESEAAMIAVGKEQSGANQPKKIAQLQQKATQAAERAAASDQEYKDVLKETNTKQQDYYHTEMPNLLNEFQQFEEERITFTKTILTRYGDLLAELPPIFQQNAADITETSNKIDHALDINKFTEENKTGVTPPPPMEYQSYEMSAPSLSSSPSSSSINPPSPAPAKGGSFIKASAQKEWGLTASDEGTTVEQKRQKLEQQLVELDNFIRSESNTKNGVEKLVQFYASDPTSQRKAENELAEAEKKIKSLQESKRQVKAQLVELNGGATDPSDTNGAANGNPESSASSPVRNSTSVNTTTTATRASVRASASVTASANNNASASTGASANVNGAGAEPEKGALVKVRGLFDYEATCDTELSFKEGDILVITEQDESGWWYAEIDGRAGFVPQNYVEVMEPR